MFFSHIKYELLIKAIEWKPELKYMLRTIDKSECIYLCNIYVLETAINTFINQDGSHKIFESETDLNYPPDFNRFLIFLTHVVKQAIEYLDSLSNVLEKNVEILDYNDTDLE